MLTVAVIICAIIITRLSIIGVNALDRPLTEKKQKATKEKQLDFLKKHEKEMTKFIQHQDNKISTVKYDWDTLKSEVVGNGTPLGGDAILTLRVTIIDSNNTNINSFGFAVVPDDIGNPTEIIDMYTINADYNYSEGEH